MPDSTHGSKRRCSVVTLGCKVNHYDSQVIRERALAAGYETVDEDAAADVVVVNTCAVTMQGTAKSRREIRRLRRKNPGARIVVTGCAAEAPGEKRGLLPDEVDLVVSNRDKARLFEILDDDAAPSRGARAGDVFGVSRFGDSTRAYLKVEDGCDEFCTFCIIPLVRGRVASREIADAVAEAKRLVAAGYREVVLTGIHLGAFGRDRNDPEALARLVMALEEVDGLERLRLSSIEASELGEPLLSALERSSNVCPHFHLPLQAGDDAVLAAMRRPYDSARYLDGVRELRARLDRPTFTTDVIVGFPGEDGAAFERTLDVCREVRFLKIHVFPYSPRTRTRATALPDRVQPREIFDRKKRLEALERDLSLSVRGEFVGEIEPVLVETKRDRDTGRLAGYTPRYVRVTFEGDDSLAGRVVPVRIAAAGARRTAGEAIESDASDAVAGAAAKASAR
jgi:threonylcarbamoyladenosine tRNA methylthiotransferase MtaB